MSTVDRSDKQTLPPLVAGQRLDRATFHERYEAMPPHTRAELVGGTVYTPSPLGLDHGERDGDLSDWLGHYKRHRPGVRRASNATAQLDDYGEPQPDLHLRIPEELGGSSRREGKYLVGPPELVVELSGTTRDYDLGPKKADYERAGVAEYLFVGLNPGEIRWFIRRSGRFVEMRPSPDGVYRSEAFPGLWLDRAAFFAEDMNRLIATLDQGLATAEHQAFVARLSEAAKRPSC